MTPQVPSGSTPPSDAAHDGRLGAATQQAGHAWEQLGQRLRGITPAALVRFLLIVIALAVVILLLVLAWGLLTPFIVGAVLAYVLLPVMDVLDRWMPRWCAILLVFAAITLLLVLAMIFLVPPLIQQLTEFVKALPDAAPMQTLAQRFDTWVTTLSPQLQQFITDAITTTEAALKTQLDDFAKQLASFFFGIASSLLSAALFLVSFFVVPFWLFWVLKDSHSNRQTSQGLLPASIRADVLGVLRTFDRVMSRWLRGTLVLSLFLGATAFVGLSLLKLLGVQGLNYILLISAFVALASPIPFLGSVVSSAIPILMALFAGGWASAIPVIALFSGIQIVQDNVLSPRIMGTHLDINPAILMPTVYILGNFGVLWIIFSAPLAAMGRDLFVYVYGRFQEPPRPAGLLPGEPLPEADQTTARSATAWPDMRRS
jgi:predicted PurR-regulated permease PerM